MSLGERPEIPFSWFSPVPSFGVTARCHDDPWRRIAMLPSAPAHPTAQMSGPEAAIPSRRLRTGSGDGDCTTDQAFPSQCIASVRQLPSALKSPTAQASVADSETPPFRSRKLEPGLGLGTTAHCVPFQRRVTDWAPLSPTAHTVLSGAADTARSVVEAGLATLVHCEPFQWRVRLLFPSSPTAQTSFDASAVTP